MPCTDMLKNGHKLITRDGIYGIKSEWLGSVLGLIWLRVRQDMIGRSSNAHAVGQDNAAFI